MRHFIGIDLGGTNIAGGVATLDGRLVHTQSVKTGMPCTPDEIADRIAALCRSLAQAAQTPLEQMAWIGVGAPGSVDKDTGVVEYANNLEFYNVPLGADAAPPVWACPSMWTTTPMRRPGANTGRALAGAAPVW